ICGNTHIGSIVGCIDKGYISCCYNTATVYGNNYAIGGIVGANYLYNEDYIAKVENCYNAGAIKGNCDVGGIVGINKSEKNKKNDIYFDFYYGYNMALVLHCYNSGTVSGKYNIGGLVGYNDGYYGCSEIYKCYNVGEISGEYNVGSIVGSYPVEYCLDVSNSLILNCYYKIGSAKDENGRAQKGIGTATYNAPIDVDGVTKGLSNEEMLKLASFVGFDFDEVWTMDGNPDYPYPELKAINSVSNSTETDKNDSEKSVLITTNDGKSVLDDDIVVVSKSVVIITCIIIILILLLMLITIFFVCFFGFRKDGFLRKKQ
nr:hypothetical protein [Clostridiales bacterium]